MPRIPKKNKDPDGVRPYLFHGLDLAWSDNDTHAIGDCPLCGGEDKFGVNIKTSQYKCWSCGTGNAQKFMGTLHELANTEPSKLKSLQENRGIKWLDTLVLWEIVLSPFTGEALVPGYNVSDRKIGQLYRYTRTPKGMKLLGTPTIGHKMFGLHLYDSPKSKVYLCEGPWDAIVLWEFLKSTKETDDGLQRTASIEMSLLVDANVLAVPGCNVFKHSWSKWFEDKDVFICFDNDHPKKNLKTGKKIQPASLQGIKRVTGILSSSKNPPNSIQYIRWGKDDFDLSLPSGTDLRDILNS